MTTLSRSERQILDILYARGRATAAEILGSLADPPSYSTTRALLRVLEQKGHVRHEEDGPRYVFFPRVSRQRASVTALRHVLNTFFEGSAVAAATALVGRLGLEAIERRTRWLGSSHRASAKGRQMMNIMIEVTLRATAVLGLAWLATALLRQTSADVRSRIWRTALAATALLFIPIPVPEALRISSATLADGGAAISGGAAASVPILLTLWMIGLLLLLGRLGISVAVLIRLTRSASAFQGLDVRVSGALMTPITWGVFRPVILLPTYVLDWPEERYAAMVRHEQAHIDRRDWLWQIVADCVTAVLWFHPLVWLAAARLRSEAEHSADDQVLADGTGANSYAGQLLEIARRLKPHPPYAAVAMTRRSRGLESRITAILDPSRARMEAGIRARLTMMLTAACLLLFLVACQSTRIYKVAQLQTPPKVVSKVEPDYTDEARNAKIQGPVVLSLTIDPQGRPEKIRITKSLDKGLDQQAIAAIEKWHFAPGIKDGKPVWAAPTIEVNFHLR